MQQEELERKGIRQGSQGSTVCHSAVRSPQVCARSSRSQARILAVCATLLRVVLCARRAVAARRSRGEWVAYSFERFIAAIKTRYTPHPDDMYSPTRQPAKRCREQSLWRQPTAEVERAACAEIDMARRPSSRTMPLARRREPAARWRAPRSARRRCAGVHPSRSPPDRERCTSYEKERRRARSPRTGAVRN